MAKYLFRARYTQAGVSGLLKEGGTSRRQALRQTIHSEERAVPGTRKLSLQRQSSAQEPGSG